MITRKNLRNEVLRFRLSLSDVSFYLRYFQGLKIIFFALNPGTHLLLSKGEPDCQEYKDLQYIYP